MTLKTFKNRITLGAILFLVLFYSFGVFVVGRLSPNFKLDYFKKEKIQNTIVKPIGTNSPFADSQSTSVISSFVKLCSNTHYSFEVSYPKDWFTTYNLDDQKCTYFAPYSFVIPQSADLPFVPIQIEAIAPQQWLETVKFHQNPNDFQNVTSSQNIQIGENSAVLVRAQTTGNGSLSRGLAIVSYMIFSNNNPVVLTYHQIDQGENVQLYEDVLREMAYSLNLF